MTPVANILIAATPGKRFERDVSYLMGMQALSRVIVNYDIGGGNGGS